LRKKVRLSLFFILYLIIGFLIYSFLFGKLFPYSPIIIGFEKHELANVIVYTQKGAEYTDFAKIDSLIPGVEQFHDLQFKRKPKIFLFGTNQSYFSHTTTRARFCAFFNGSIVVSPWAQKEAIEGVISMEIYLTHELSHSLLHQHAGIIRALKYPKWLLEGIAVYSSSQMGTSWYPSKEETYQYIRQGNFMPPDYFKTKKEDEIELDVENRIPFMYSEFACVVDYLVAQYGKEKFLTYMKRLVQERDHNIVFEEVFCIDFDAFLKEFQETVKSSENSQVFRFFPKKCKDGYYA
jgi:predicted SprT family Zn-dependent metalloprotease